MSENTIDLGADVNTMKELLIQPEQKPVPEVTEDNKPLPQVGKPENTVVIGGHIIEIKPTMVKHHRNRTAAFYKVLDCYPLPDIYAMSKEAIGDPVRDGDKCIFDWLLAALDHSSREGVAEQVLKDHYLEMDSGTIEKILAIFKRVNKIEEKEANLKKQQAEKGVMG